MTHLNTHTHSDLEKVQLLEKNNRRRLERLKRVHKRVHNKDFAKKENSLRSNIAVDQAQATRQFAELVATRREFITQLYHRVFPIEVLPLSDEDAGAEGMSCPGLHYVPRMKPWHVGTLHRELPNY